MADDFRLMIALKAFGARVPADDNTIDINHIDRIIGYCLDKKAITPLLAQ